MASSGKPATTMSSRLLTMKFMQRAAASPSNSASNSPDQHSAKRQRLSNGSSRSTSTAHNIDAEAIQQALAAEEQKRQAAIDREAEKRGESKWVLSVQSPATPSKPAMKVISAGYAALDSDTIPTYGDDDAFSTPASGRRSFGVAVAKTAEEKADDESDGSSSDDDEHTSSQPRNHQRPSLGDTIREKQSAKRKLDNQQSSQQAGQRRSKQVNLNKLTSISNAGSSGSPRDMSNVKCHKCGKTGHIKAKCPKNR